MTETPVPAPRAANRPEVRAARTVARLLDEAITLPIINRRIGIDGLIGLIPGIGDAVGAGLSSIVLFISARAGVSTSVLLRMAGNVLVELAIGAIPILGDLFDFVWKANTRNADLLEAALDDPAAVGRRSTGVLVAVLAGVTAVAGGIVYGVYTLLAMLIGAIAGG